MSPRPIAAAALAACPPSQRAALAAQLSSRATHQRVGARSRAGGDAFERDVARALDVLTRLGILAWWSWTGPRCRATKIAGRLAMVPVADGPCDVIACAADGRCVAIEAKRSESRVPLAGDGIRGLRPHQRAQLDAVDLAGGVALLVVEVAGIVAVIPWAAARDLAGVGVTVARAHAVTDLAAGILGALRRQDALSPVPTPPRAQGGRLDGSAGVSR